MTALLTAGELRTTAPRHLVSSRNLTVDGIREFFTRADEFRVRAFAELPQTLSGQVLGVLFFQPSTRTRLGFEASAVRLGARVIGFADVSTTRSVDYTAESLEDTIRVVAELADGVVMRHFLSGAARRAAAVSRVPVVNGGDGTNEHPTQALSDAWLMHRRLGGLDNAVIGLVGDPGTRVLRSLAVTLATLGVGKLLFQVPPVLPLVGTESGGIVDTTLPSDIRSVLEAAGVPFEFRSDIRDVLAEADALEMLPVDIPALEAHPKSLSKSLYVTPERFRVTREKIESVASRTLLFHPGPRADELDADTDNLVNSVYFEQVRESTYMRMAVLSECMGATAQGGAR